MRNIIRSWYQKFILVGTTTLKVKAVIQKKIEKEGRPVSDPGDKNFIARVDEESLVMTSTDGSLSTNGDNGEESPRLSRSENSDIPISTRDQAVDTRSVLSTISNSDDQYFQDDDNDDNDDGVDEHPELAVEMETMLFDISVGDILEY